MPPVLRGSIPMDQVMTAPVAVGPTLAARGTTNPPNPIHWPSSISTPSQVPAKIMEK